MADKTYATASQSAVVAHAAKADEMKLTGLQNIQLPIGITVNTVTIDELGAVVSKIAPVGKTLEEVSVNYNWTPKSKSSAYLTQAQLDDTEIQDMRFYVDKNKLCGDYVAPDIISDPAACYYIGTISNPSGSNQELYSGSFSFLPAGPSSVFNCHANGTDLAFTAGAGATIASTVQDFVVLGFEADMIIQLDYVNALDPMTCVIESVAANLITLKDSIGDEASVPTFAGIATTAIHAGKTVAASSGATNC
jgi:hypothetical protein